MFCGLRLRPLLAGACCSLAMFYILDAGLYAGAVTLSTVLSLVTLPVWFALVQ